MDLIEFVTPRVREAYWGHDAHCTPTMLNILGEIFNVPIYEQVYHAASGMHGAGLFGAQCGLVEGALMFIGLAGRGKGMTIDDVEPICYEFADRFQKEFGSLICRELRPEGFSDDNPPHICEPRTVEAIVFAAEYIAEKLDFET
jgi:C_GCAxxG_C_C family probable redox protein